MSPFKFKSGQKYFSPTWILCLTIASYSYGYFILEDHNWWLMATTFNIAVYFLGMAFKPTRMLCLILIILTIISYTGVLKNFLNSRTINKNLVITELSGEISRTSSNNKLQIELVNVELTDRLRKHYLPQAVISIEKNTGIATTNFRTSNRYIFQNLKFVDASKTNTYFSYNIESIYFNKTSIENNFKFSNFYHYLVAKVNYYLPDSESQLIKTIVLNYRKDLAPKLNDTLKKAGIFHILSVSGLHLVQVFLFCKIIFSLLFVFIRKYNLNKFSEYLTMLPDILSVIVCFYYVKMLNYPIPASRAWTFLGLYIATKHFTPFIPTIFKFLLVASVILIVEPWILGSISFLLSFLASFGLIISYDFFNRYLTKNDKGYLTQIKLYLSLIFISSLIITVLSLPINILIFGGFNWMTPLNNIIHVPFTSIFLIPFAFLLIPILAFKYLFISFYSSLGIENFIELLINLYFYALSMFVKIWLYLIDINHNMVEIGYTEIRNTNPNLFVYTWMVIVIFSTIIMSYWAYRLKFKAMVKN